MNLKKLIVVIVLLVLSVSSLFCEELSKAALLVKKVDRDNIFREIVVNAKAKWTDDPEMIIHDINEQSEAVVEFAKITRLDSYHERTMAGALRDWKGDWIMVVHTYKKRNKARLQVLNLGKY